MEGFTEANMFELSGDDINVTYSATSFSGQPIFSYRDNIRSLSFSSNEINIQDTPIGKLVTVTIETIPDLRTIEFTLIIPVVTVMKQSTGTCIKVPGITTTSPTTIAGPPPGPQQLYTITNLRGTALTITP